MSRVFRCPGCGKKLKVPGDLAGKKVRCPNCKVGLKIPALPPAIATPTPQSAAPAASSLQASAPILPPASSLESLLPPHASAPVASATPMVTQLVTRPQLAPGNPD